MIAAGIPLALLALFYGLSPYRTVMEKISTKVSEPVLRFLGGKLSAVNFSFMEADIALVLLAAGIWIFFFLKGILAGPAPRLPLLARRLLVLLAVAAWIWNGYCWLWNSGYYVSSFAEEAGLETRGLSAQELTRAAEFFLEKTNELSTQVPRNDDGICVCSLEGILSTAEKLYDPLEKEFPCLVGPQTVPKGVHYSKIMSMTGFTGVFFPFTGETYINVHQPGWGIPDTVSHELSHQRGVHLEAEANFCGIAACIQSENALYQYSGYMSGLIHLTNALYKADRDAWNSLRERFSDELRTDWNYNSDYWREMEGTVNKVTDKVYDSFLKVNTQPEGLKSYGQCVDLLVLWLEESPYSPMREG